MKVEVDVLGSPSLIAVLMVFVDIKQHHEHERGAQSELRNCVKVEVAVLGSSSLTVPTASVDVEQH